MDKFQKIALWIMGTMVLVYILYICWNEFGPTRYNKLMDKRNEIAELEIENGNLHQEYLLEAIERVKNEPFILQVHADGAPLPDKKHQNGDKTNIIPIGTANNKKPNNNTKKTEVKKEEPKQ